MGGDLQTVETGYQAAMISAEHAKTAGMETQASLQKIMGGDLSMGSLDSAIDTTIRQDVGLLGGVVRSNVGTEVNPTTHVSLQTELDAEVNILIELSGNTDPSAFSQETLTRAGDILSSVPEIAAMFNAQGANRDEIVREMLGKPEVRALVRDGSIQLLSTSSIPSDEVTPAEQEAERLEKQETGLRTRRDKKDKDLNGRDGALERYDRFQQGDLADKLRDLGGRLPQIDARISSSERAKGRWEQEVTRLEGEVFRRQAANVSTKDAQDLLDHAKDEFDKADRAFRAAAAERAEYDSLVAEKAGLPGKIEKLEDDLAALEVKLAETTKQRFIAAATRDQKTLDRQKARLQFAQKVKNVLPEALKKQLKAGDAARVKKLREEIAQSVEVTDRLMMTEAAVRYRKGRKDDTGYDRRSSAMATDTALLMVEDPNNPNNGRDALVRAVLTDALGREVTAGRMTKDKADAIIKERMADKDFVARMGSITTEALIRAKINTGGLTKEEHDIIRHNSNPGGWGVDLINRALRVNPGSADSLQVLRDQGLVEDDLVEAVRRADRKALTKIFLTLFSVGMVSTGAVLGAVPLAGVGAVAAVGTLGKMGREEIEKRRNRSAVS